MVSETHATARLALDGLIASVREVVTTEFDQARVAERVAQILHPYLDHNDLLTDARREPDPNAYRQHILHIEEDGSFSIVALVWLPGQDTPIHDHVTWCVVGVYEGREHETRYHLAQNRVDEPYYLAEAGQVTNLPGSVAGLTPPGDIHQVRNSGSELAISLHVYGADIGRLGSSVRRRYELEVRPGT